MSLGVDFSQWGGALKPETVECWKDSGVKFAVVQYSERMTQHLDVLTAAGGLDVEGYVYLYWGHAPFPPPFDLTPEQRVHRALDVAGNRISRLWLDAEDSTHPYDEGQLIACVEACESRGMPCGIYTGRWWWVPETGDSRAFMHLPLWHAEYTEPNFDAFQSYGGWQRPAIWQYQGTTNLCGHSVDLNVKEDVAPPPEPEPPAPWQPTEIESLRAFISAGQFVRMNWNLADLADVDKQAIRHVAGQF